MTFAFCWLVKCGPGLGVPWAGGEFATQREKQIGWVRARTGP